MLSGNDSQQAPRETLECHRHFEVAQQSTTSRKRRGRTASWKFRAAENTSCAQEPIRGEVFVAVGRQKQQQQRRKKMCLALLFWRLSDCTAIVLAKRGAAAIERVSSGVEWTMACCDIACSSDGECDKIVLKTKLHR